MKLLFIEKHTAPKNINQNNQKDYKHLLIIILNINGLNFQIKIHKPAEWLKKQNLPLRKMVRKKVFQANAVKK